MHTGDFRGHGRRGEVMTEVINKCVHYGGRQVHTLITEGTMMSRLNEKIKTETELFVFDNTLAIFTEKPDYRLKLIHI